MKEFFNDLSKAEKIEVTIYCSVTAILGISIVVVEIVKHFIK